MAGDFLNFLIIYIVLVILFCIVGNFNFLFSCTDFASPFHSLITIIDASMGNYDFEIFDQIEDTKLRNFGKAYLMLSVVIFTILILNLIIAILSNTYNIFDPKSNGLYLSKILSTRDELQHDENYSAFITALSPLNLIILPLVPIFALMKPNPKLNGLVMKLQYLLLMLILFIGFIIISLLLLPFAYLKSLIFKLRQIFIPGATPIQIAQKSAAFIIFLFMGIPIMLMTQMADCFYFWANNFRVQLKKIVIETEQTAITNESIKRIMFLCGKYQHNRIKGIYTIDYIKKLREDLGINSLLQYLIFGQFITTNKKDEADMGGHADQSQNYQSQIQRMQTDNMRERRRTEKAARNQKENLNNALQKLKQFNEIKRISSNQSFYNNNNALLCTEIVYDIFDEMRRERKIMMAINESGHVQEYVKQDLSQYDTSGKSKLDTEKMPPIIRHIIEKKEVFKHEMIQKLSIIKLCFIFKVI